MTSTNPFRNPVVGALIVLLTALAYVPLDPVRQTAATLLILLAPGSVALALIGGWRPFASAARSAAIFLVADLSLPTLVGLLLGYSHIGIRRSSVALTLGLACLLLWGVARLVAMDEYPPASGDDSFQTAVTGSRILLGVVTAAFTVAAITVSIISARHSDDAARYTQLTANQSGADPKSHQIAVSILNHEKTDMDYRVELAEASAPAQQSTVHVGSGATGRVNFTATATGTVDINLYRSSSPDEIYRTVHLSIAG